MPRGCSGLLLCILLLVPLGMARADECQLLPDLAPCDDGLFCNGLDFCQGGACVGHVGDPCLVALPCATTCDEAQKICADPAGTPCADDGNPCTADVCNGSGSCVHPPGNDGASCDDGQFCNGADTCSGGSCTHAGNPCASGPQCANTCEEAARNCLTPVGTGCTDDGNPCTDDVCDGAGACVHPNNTASCNDGFFCTVNDVCSGGTCHGTPRDCSAAGDACNVGVCSEAKSACVPQPIPGGTSCDDGIFCNGADTCSGGVCTHAGDPCPGPNGNNNCAESCNEAAKNCTAPDPDGSACNDGQFCTVNDRCTSGVCHGTPRDCSSAGNACNDGVCNEATNACVARPKPNGTPCTDDGLFCDGAEVCTTGTCGHTGNPCTGGAECANTCNEAAKNCLAAAGTACTGDGNPCTDDRCNGAGACTHPNNTAPCDDGVFCNGADTCSGGSCSVHAGNPCPGPDGDGNCAESCNEAANNCTAPDPDGSPCNDGNACTRTDTCQGGSCRGGNPVVCTAQDDCHTAGVCNTATGTCSNPVRPDGSACDDGNACTRSDKCLAGSCTGTNPVVCTALDQCHDVGVCDRGTGTCSEPPKADGTSCNDGDACTRTDICEAGTCTGTNPVVCDTADPCVGTCDRSTGACTTNVRPDGASCNDGNLCTLRDTCHGGICIAGPPVVCVPKDQCHVAGVCAPATGICSDPPARDGSSCDDNNVCTVGDVCQAGLCAGVRVPAPRCCLADAECTDGIACTEDRCLANSCVAIPMDGRCGGGGDCLGPACVPTDPGAGPDGCILRAANEDAYCTEDSNPCTIDACRSGNCQHEPDGSGPTCPQLDPPFDTALGLLARTTDVRAAVAAIVACAGAGGVTCQATSGTTSTNRLLMLVDSISTDLQAAILALGGRFSPSTPGDPTRDPTVRARLASGLVGGTPDTVRAFLATLQQARSGKVVSSAFARIERAEGRRLLRGANKLRRQLAHILFRRSTFAR